MKITLQELEALSKAGFTPKIETPTGPERITQTYRKHDTGFDLTFSDGTSFRAAAKHLIQVDGEFVNTEDLDVGQDFGTKVLASKTEVPAQEWIDFSIDAPHESYHFNDMVHHNSGKSFIQYLIQQYYQRTEGVRSLIVVPTVSLVLQMKDDFVSYGCDPDMIHTIKGGSSKVTNHPIVISTWQSLQGMDREWFRQFELVCGDEAHLFTAKSLITIMESLSEARYRHGFSGTIPKSSKVNQMLLEGVFGGTTQYVTTSDLIASGTVADFKIKAIVLKHSKESSAEFKNAAKKLASAQRYAAEKVYLANHTKRNNFIVNLVKSQKDKNALILFDLVEKQGKVLLPLLREIEGRKVHFIHGGVSGEERERIRKLVENDPEKNHIILASSPTLSTGFSLKRLDYIIFSASSKSEVRVLQSIGRVLRKGNGSDDATLYDIADDLSFGSTENYTLQHFRDRVQFYTDQQFDMKVFTVNLE